MRILAVLSPAPGATFASIEPLLLREERLAWQFYRKDFVREFYRTDRQGTVIVIAEANSIDEVRSRFTALPLIQARLLQAEYFQLQPFLNWQLLFDKEQLP